jgi:sugar lactone lactonase YvrE
MTVTEKGRVFANFPRWRKGVPFAVAEVMPDGTPKPYPNKELNSWEIGQPVSEKFICVQAVVAHKGKLYILDTANPMFAGIISQPKVYVYDLNTDTLEKTYTFPENVVKKTSYINDLRIDDKKEKIYLTDSGAAGLVIIDINTGLYTRVLDDHPYTKAEADHLTFKGKVWKNTVHSDGIELDVKKDILYFHALTGYTLYGIKTGDLLDAEKLKTVKPFRLKTGAFDGMIIDDKGDIYFADLEKNKIQYLTPDRKRIKTLVEGDAVKWADTFSIYNGYLYFTNSRVNEAGGDISGLDFTINKVKLP